MNNLSQSKTENSDAKIRFRCPTCSKLYSSNAKAIFVEKPQFKCTSCDSDFYIVLNEALNNSEVVGYKFIPEMTKSVEPEAPVEESSPKVKVNIEDVDWSLVEDDVDFKKVEAPKLKSLDVRWSMVMDSYNDKGVHKDFINASKAEDNVEFAKSKYSDILKNNPFDEVARSCFNLIEIEEQTKILLEQESEKGEMKRSFWSAIIVATGVLFIVLGLFVIPEHQRLAGLGLGLVVFTFALKSLFQKSQSPY